MIRFTLLSVLFLALTMSDAINDEIRAQLVSPQVNDDRSVTFRLRAPNAESVLVKGIAGHADIVMAKSDRGIWEATSEPLAPELYSYTFEVDGALQIDPSNRFVKKWLTCGSLVEIRGDKPLLTEKTNVDHGVVHHHIYPSDAAGHQRGVYVYTPPGYPSDTEEPYPVMFLLHGYGDDESAWLEVGRANFVADNLIDQGRIRPTVIVMPYGHPVTLDLRQQYDDYADRNVKTMEKDLVDDLLPFIEANYQVSSDRGDRAIVGLSMGGGQSLSIGLRNRNQFAWIGGFSSASPQGSDEEINKALKGLASDAANANAEIKLLWIGCGRDDFLLERNNRFIKWLEENEIEHTYSLTDGGHDWMVWRKYLVTFLEASFADESK